MQSFSYPSAFSFPVIILYSLNGFTCGILHHAYQPCCFETKTQFFETIVLVVASHEWRRQCRMDLRCAYHQSASGNQHHDTDFKLLQGVSLNWSSSKTVVLFLTVILNCPTTVLSFENAVYPSITMLNCAMNALPISRIGCSYLSNPSVFSRACRPLC